jgi:WD40 repeat protein
MICLWDMTGESPTQIAAVIGHAGSVNALAFSADSKQLVSGGGDRTVRLWDLSKGRPADKGAFSTHVGNVRGVGFLPDGKAVVSAGEDGTIRMWTDRKLWGWKETAFHGTAGAIRSMGVLPVGMAVAFGGLDQTVRIWSLASDPPVERLVLTGHSGPVRLVVCPADGKTLLTVGERGLIMAWDAERGDRLNEWELPKSILCGVATTADGRYLAAATSDCTVGVFRLYSRSNEEK